MKNDIDGTARFVAAKDAKWNQDGECAHLTALATLLVMSSHATNDG